MIQKLLKDPVIQSRRLEREDDDLLVSGSKAAAKAGTSSTADGANGTSSGKSGDDQDQMPDDLSKYIEKMENDDDDDENSTLVSFEVALKEIETQVSMYFPAVLESHSSV